MIEQEFLTKGKYSLRHWQFYERNLNKLAFTDKHHAVTLFKSLKELEPVELKAVAERYYKSTVPCNYDNYIGDYRTVKPIALAKVASKLSLPLKEATELLKRAEHRVGHLSNKFERETERKQAVSNVTKIRDIMLGPFQDKHEITILKQAFDEIALYRDKEKENVNAWEIQQEERRLRWLGIM